MPSKVVLVVVVDRMLRRPVRVVGGQGSLTPPLSCDVAAPTLVPCQQRDDVVNGSGRDALGLEMAIRHSFLLEKIPAMAMLGNSPLRVWCCGCWLVHVAAGYE